MPSIRWSGSSEIKTDGAFEMSKDIYPVTRRHNTEDMKLLQQSSETPPPHPKIAHVWLSTKELQENTKLYRIRFELRIAVTINTADVWLTVHRNSAWIRKTN